RCARASSRRVEGRMLQVWPLAHFRDHSFFQNASFSPNCSCLGSFPVARLDMRPNVGLPRVLPGMPRFMMLKVLKLSIRSSALYRSVKSNLLNSERSIFGTGSVDRMFLPVFPYESTGTPKAPVLDRK